MKLKNKKVYEIDLNGRTYTKRMGRIEYILTSILELAFYLLAGAIVLAGALSLVAVLFLIVNWILYQVSYKRL